MVSALRILICRVVFLFLVLLPTLVVSAWAVQRSQPFYRNAQLTEWQQSLAQKLGLKIEIAQVTYPAYWVARIDGLTLTDPETNAKLLTCRSLEATRTKTAWIVEASQPELELSQLGLLWQLLEGRILREFTADQLPCEIEIGELTLRAGEQAQTVTNVFAACRSVPQGSEVTLEFRLAGVETPQPCRLLLQRRRDVSPPVTSWEFDTAGIAIPCALFAKHLPWFATLGNEARFVGTAKGTFSATSQQGEINGRFLQLDLATLVTQHSSHRLTGLADVVCQLRYHDGQVEEIQGNLDARGGYFGETLFQAAREHLRLGIESEESLPVQDGLLPYRRLAVDFKLSAAGLHLTGVADPTRPGVVLTNGSRALLLDPTEQPLLASAIIRTLVPQPEYQVPAAKESLPLLQLLPAPSVSPTPREPKVRVRLGS